MRELLREYAAFLILLACFLVGLVAGFANNP
jgi:hypothetical protein